MTPAARIAAAAEILDRVIGGEPAEQCLTTWARKSRFAGSGDRAAIRDLVFDGLRRKRSLGWIGAGASGRALMIGRLRAEGLDPAEYFTGEGHAPAMLSAAESAAPPEIDTAPEPVRFDCPDWLWPVFLRSQGALAKEVLAALQRRAPVSLRINQAKATPDQALEALARDGVQAIAGPLSPTALVVTGNPRRVHGSTSYREGLVELQDAASQAVVDRVTPFAAARTVLDYCAGGGGKALQLAAAGAARVVAYDANPERMRDIPTRAKRGGHTIEIARSPGGLFDCVLVDAPCSGSGAWRRQPESKWRLTPERLGELCALQDGILDRAAGFVRPAGALAYATCSLFEEENGERVEAFLKRSHIWTEVSRERFTPLDGGDGFFVAILRKHA